jgi:hypothetical protein
MAHEHIPFEDVLFTCSPSTYTWRDSILTESDTSSCSTSTRIANDSFPLGILHSFDVRSLAFDYSSSNRRNPRTLDSRRRTIQLTQTLDNRSSRLAGCLVILLALWIFFACAAKFMKALMNVCLSNQSFLFHSCHATPSHVALHPILHFAWVRA